MHQHLPVAGTSPISPGARLGWKPLLSLMLSASSSSMNEFLQQISSSTWLQAKRQVSKGDWSYDRMSECLRQRTHWGNRDGKPLNVMTKSATFVTKKVQICGQKKKRWVDNFHITSLLSFGYHLVKIMFLPTLVLIFQTEGAFTPSLLFVLLYLKTPWIFYPEQSAWIHWTVTLHTWLTPASSDWILGSSICTLVLRKLTNNTPTALQRAGMHHISG